MPSDVPASVPWYRSRSADSGVGPQARWRIKLATTASAPTSDVPKSTGEGRGTIPDKLLKPYAYPSSEPSWRQVGLRASQKTVGWNSVRSGAVTDPPGSTSTADPMAKSRPSPVTTEGI